LARKRRQKVVTSRPSATPARTGSASVAERAPSPPGRALAGLLVLSGFTALVYETLWVRQLGRVVGVEVHAVTIALSAFFAGLALGGAILGRRADRSSRPVRLYAILEAGVAVLGVLSTLALARAAAPFVALREAVGPLAWALPFVLVGLPSFLMGGTLPALLRALRPDQSGVAPATGVLYGANTAGAVLGTLATPFVLVPAFGIRGTGFVAAASGLVIALAALAIDRRASAVPTSESTEARRASRTKDVRLALALYAVAGGVALGCEVVWSELLVQFLSTRTYAFAVMLGTYLTGLALGSFLFARFSRPEHDPWRVFGLLLTAAGGSAILIAAALGPWLPDAQTFAGMWAARLTGLETVEALARFAVASVTILLVPTTLLGAAFPAAARLTASADRVGGDVGLVAALNTAGGIAGTLLTGFVLVPRIGLIGSLGLLAVGGALIGGVAILRSAKPRAPAIAGTLVLAVGLSALATPRDSLARLLAEERGGRLVFYSEDAGGTVAVLEQEATGRGGGSFRRLYIQGVSNSGDALASLRYMRLQALLPLLVHPEEPRSVMVVGFGTGITAGALLVHPSLETRVVAELLQPVIDAGGHFTGNFDASRDPRLEIRIGDGRHELLRRSEPYDLITLEPPPPSASGVVNLYSRDFYELCRERLAPGGVMAQWWPLPTQNEEDSRSLVRSFLDVFPYASAWSTELHEVLLVGSLAPLALDGPRVAERFAAPGIASTLTDVGVESPEALLGTWLTGREGLEAFAGDAPAVTDDRPLIEHAAWVRRGEIHRVLPRLLELATDVPLVESDPLRLGVSEEVRELRQLYRASLLALDGRQEEAVAMVLEVLNRDPNNPYYRWIALGE
jgi:spermidine synthase